MNDFQFNFTQCISIETNAIQRLLKNQAIEIVAEQWNGQSKRVNKNKIIMGYQNLIRLQRHKNIPIRLY